MAIGQNARCVAGSVIDLASRRANVERFDKCRTECQRQWRAGRVWRHGGLVHAEDLLARPGAQLSFGTIRELPESIKSSADFDQVEL